MRRQGACGSAAVGGRREAVSEQNAMKCYSVGGRTFGEMLKGTEAGGEGQAGAP